MAHEFQLTRQVEFSETDMAGIVHFSNFFRYMESVEHAFLRSLGHSVVMRHLDPPCGFPRVHAKCDYKHPLYFEDTFRMHLLVSGRSPRSIHYQIRFHRLEPKPRDFLAVGTLIVVCVQRDQEGQMRAVPLPESLEGQIQVAPAELLALPESF